MSLRVSGKNMNIGEALRVHVQGKVAAAVGKDRSTIANFVRLLKLPEFVLGALRDGRISAGHARAMLPLATGTSDDDAGHAELRRVLARVLAQTLNVRQTERLVASIVRAPTTAVTTQSGKVRQERTLQYAVKLIEESLHTSVEIRPKTKGGGRIVLDYSDAEDLERIIGLLRGSRS